MKRRLILLATALASTQALAGDSVLTLKQLSTDGDGVITINCTACPPLSVKNERPNVHGVEVTETMIGGEKKIIQTDNLMGGSAVRYVKSSPSNRTSAGEMIARTEGGTSVTVGHEGTIHVRPDLQPVSASMGDNVTYGGGGEFQVENVEPNGEERTVNGGVDSVSRTSSIDMNDAEHRIMDGNRIAVPAAEGETEILKLRPTH